MFELHETGDWDILPCPPERARAETGGADQWVFKRRKCSGFVRVNKVTSASLGYPLSVFNKNSTLKKKEESIAVEGATGTTGYEPIHYQSSPSYQKTTIFQKREGNVYSSNESSRGRSLREANV